MTQRLYKTSMLKEAFNAMTRDRLGRSQDGYECFVVSAFANSYHPSRNVVDTCITMAAGSVALI